ncbi:hypothetical protein [Achromobacter sp. AGC39]
MNEFLVRQAHAVHDGGTKFYAVYEITCGHRRAVLCHWGPVSVSRRPSDGGAHQLHPNASEKKMESEITRKSRSGYRDWRRSQPLPYDAVQLKELIGINAMERVIVTFADEHEEEARWEPLEPEESVTCETAADESWGSW